MQSDASLSWLALALTAGLASRFFAPLLRRVESPGGGFPSQSRRSGGLSSPSSSLASHRKEGKFQAGRERIGGHSENCRLLPLELDRARISADALTNLRPAGHALCPR